MYSILKSGMYLPLQPISIWLTTFQVFNSQYGEWLSYWTVQVQTKRNQDIQEVLGLQAKDHVTMWRKKRSKEGKNLAISLPIPYLCPTGMRYSGSYRKQAKFYKSYCQNLLYSDKFALLIEIINIVFIEYSIFVSVQFWSNLEKLLLSFESMLQVDHESFNSSSMGGGMVGKSNCERSPG